MSSYAIHSGDGHKLRSQGGLEAFRATGNKVGIQPAHAARLKRQLAQLDRASDARDMNLPGWPLHALKGELAGHWAVWVSGNWRLTTVFDGADVAVVDHRDYR